MAESKAKKEEAAVEASESHVDTESTEQPDLSAQRAVEAHRQANVLSRSAAPAKTGDDSAVDPQPDRDAVGEPVDWSPKVEGEHQVTEQPDLYAVGDDAQSYAEGPKKRGRRKKADSESESSDDGGQSWPAQYEGDEKDGIPAQYSF